MELAITGKIYATLSMVFYSNNREKRDSIHSSYVWNVLKSNIEGSNGSQWARVYENPSKCGGLLSINLSNCFRTNFAVPNSNFKSIGVLVLNLNECVPALLDFSHVRLRPLVVLGRVYRTCDGIKCVVQVLRRQFLS